jgi:hypothetical protein
VSSSLVVPATNKNSPSPKNGLFLFVGWDYKTHKNMGLKFSEPWRRSGIVKIQDPSHSDLRDLGLFLFLPFHGRGLGDLQKRKAAAVGQK